jgi:hypothetical protein
VKRLLLFFFGDPLQIITSLSYVQNQLSLVIVFFGLYGEMKEKCLAMAKSEFLIEKRKNDRHEKNIKQKRS